MPLFRRRQPSPERASEGSLAAAFLDEMQALGDRQIGLIGDAWNSIDEAERSAAWASAREATKRAGVNAAKHSSEIVKAARRWANDRPRGRRDPAWTDEDKAVRRRAGPAIIGAGVATILGDRLDAVAAATLLAAWRAGHEL